jgi:hypothetical protein
MLVLNSYPPKKKVRTVEWLKWERAHRASMMLWVQTPVLPKTKQMNKKPPLSKVKRPKRAGVRLKSLPAFEFKDLSSNPSTAKETKKTDSKYTHPKIILRVSRSPQKKKSTPYQNSKEYEQPVH